MTTTLQTSAPLGNLNVQTLNRPVFELAHLAEERQLDLAPSYQRMSVWSETQRRMLVKSLMVGLPVPAVVLNVRAGRQWRDGGDFAYALVDGKQRVESLLAWFRGELSVPASWFAPEHVVTTVDTEDGAYVTVDGLTPEEARYCKMTWALPCVETKLSTVAEEAQAFGLVNGGGVSQTEEDLARAATVAATAGLV